MAALAFLKEQLLQPIRVPFMSLPLQVVLKILEISKLKEGDVIYDLGCGDGRILVEGGCSKNISNAILKLNVEYC